MEQAIQLEGAERALSLRHCLHLKVNSNTQLCTVQ